MSDTVLITSYAKSNIETSADRKSKTNIKEKQNILTQFKHQLYLIAKKFGIK